MAININPGTPLRHVATFNASGNFTPPLGVTSGFVSIHSSTGGGSGSQGGQSGNAGGGGSVAAAFVQLNSGAAHSVTIGAGGAGANGSVAPAYSGTGATGGTTSFDAAIFLTGTAGGVGNSSRYTGGSAGATGGTATGQTSLTSLSPAGALIRTGTISTQNTGGLAGGNGGVAPGNRYQSGNAGTAGVSGQIHIYT